MSRNSRIPAFRRRPTKNMPVVRNTKWKRKSRARFPSKAVVVMGLIFVLVLGWFALKERLTPPEPTDVVDMSFRLCGHGGRGPCVIDGDTLAIGERRVRLTGFDAPEMDGACDNERHKALMARDRLAAWLMQGPFEWTGGPLPPRDRYGRELRAARRGDELLADVMIEAGLAEEMGWGADRVEWCE